MLKNITAIALSLGLAFGSAQACTGISLESADQSQIVARTIEWGASVLKTDIVLVPRKHSVQTQTAEGPCLQYQTRFGFVGLSIESENFVVEGVNEKGLSAGLFFFPKYGRYPDYDKNQSSRTIGDMQFVAYVLGQFDSVESARQGIANLRLAETIKGAGTVHFRIADSTGKQIAVEVIDGKMQIIDNPLGVLTNSPDLRWHLTHLNQYMNWQTGPLADRSFGPLKLSQFGVGAGLQGVPGDISPASRFVRAAIMQETAPKLADAKEAVLYSFSILNSFDIPIGLEISGTQESNPLISATQWTSSTDMTHRKLYYRSALNAQIRMIDLNDIDFSQARYGVQPLETVSEQPIEALTLQANSKKK